MNMCVCVYESDKDNVYMQYSWSISLREAVSVCVGVSVNGSDRVCIHLDNYIMSGYLCVCASGPHYRIIE